MTVLTEKQLDTGYFREIGGFSPLCIIKEVKDYKGEDRICIACTQLDYLGYNEREQKRILNEWIDLLRTDTKLLSALHFNSRVPQSLFNAACSQENLEELRFKWGPYKDISALDNLKKLQFLYIGTGASVQDISVLGKLKNLIVLLIENFKRIEDYDDLATLDKLEQLVIRPTNLGNNVPIKDLEFLREMHSLVSVVLSAKIIRKYTAYELNDLNASLPNLRGYCGRAWIPRSINKL